MQQVMFFQREIRLPMSQYQSTGRAAENSGNSAAPLMPTVLTSTPVWLNDLGQAGTVKCMWKPCGCSSLVSHTLAVIFPTLNCLAKEQEKSNRKQPGKLSSFSLGFMFIRAVNEASSSAQMEISPNNPEILHPPAAFPCLQHSTLLPVTPQNQTQHRASGRSK